MSINFADYWRTNFPECPPVSYLLRDKLKDRWFRIHSLPESKRYAENEGEQSEILRRQKLLLENIIGENEKCLFIWGCYSQSPKESYKKKFPEFASLFTNELEPIAVETFAPEQVSEDEEYFFTVAYGESLLKISELNKTLLAVANWEIAYFFIVNPRLNRIFAPYDGGVDLILESSNKRDEYKLKYSDWLSQHPQGL